MEEVIKQYLIFEEEAEANERADENGQQIGYSFWKTGVGTKWATAPRETADGRWALRVDYRYELTEEEEELKVSEDDVVFPTFEDE